MMRSRNYCRILTLCQKREMRNTWGWIEYGGGSRVGKENFFQKLKKKFDKGGGTGYSHVCDELF
jgi:hypothetical protein